MESTFVIDYLKIVQDKQFFVTTHNPVFIRFMQQMAPSCLQNEVTVLGKIFGVTTDCLHILFILFRLMAHIDR